MEPAGESIVCDVELIKIGRTRKIDSERKRRILWMMVGYSGLLGVLYAVTPINDDAIDFAMEIPLLAFAVRWCFEDARQRDFRLGRFLRLGLILFFVGAFPVYALRSRGLAGVAMIAKAVVFAALIWCCIFMTNFVTSSLVD